MSSEERVLNGMLQTDKGRAWLAHCMIHGRSANKDVFEREYAVRRMQAEAAERQRVREYRKIPLHQRVYGVITFQVFHLRTFGFWHPSGFIGPIFYGREDAR